MHAYAAIPAALLLTGLAGVCGAQFVEPTTILATYDGDAASDLLGFITEDVGDLTGDGVHEYALTAPGFDGLAPAGGVVRVYNGATYDLHWEVVGDVELGFLGVSVAPAGDVNADGVIDVAAGAPAGLFNPTGSAPGDAFVFSGVDGTILLHFTGEVDGDFFGATVDQAGDVDGDGHDDVLVGASFADPAGDNSGRAYVYSGADGALVRTYDGEAAGALLGGGMSGFADVNDDGIREHAVAAINANGGRGRIHVYDGATGAPLFDPFDGDADSINMGWFFLSPAGDVNADGIGDLFVPDFQNSALGPGTGRAFILSGADGTAIRTYTGAGPGEGFGIGRGAGDADGDGYGDLVIGSWTNSDGAAQGGKVEVISGRDGSILQTYTHTRAFSNLGYDAIAVGDANGDGRIDYLLSAAQDDATGNNAGRVYLVAGDIDAAIPGDLNGDGCVDQADLEALLSSYSVDDGGDLDGDGDTDQADLGTLLGHFGVGC
jgi:hypothetical protein